MDDNALVPDGVVLAGPWDLSQERVFIENLFCQRFNFFIVIFSLVVAGAASANTQLKLSAVLWVGFTLCVLVGLTLYRNFVKLIWILKRLHRIEAHPVAITGAGVKKEYGRLAFIGVNPILGVVIPIVCCLVLLLGAVGASRGDLPANDPEVTLVTSR